MDCCWDFGFVAVSRIGATSIALPKLPLTKHHLVGSTRRVSIATCSRVELVRPVEPRTISHVIFDFDGTVSWLRRGWPDLMTELFVEQLPASLSSSAQLREQLREDVLRLNGKPSLNQMLRFGERMQELGRPPADAESLLAEYLRRLAHMVRHRVDQLSTGEAKRSDFVVRAVIPLLEALQARGLTLVILSGTAEPEVKHEAELLGVAPYFREHIYGATSSSFSKKSVIDRLLLDEKIAGSQLLSFGDGPVEIRFTKAVGGLAIGVASEESAGGPGTGDRVKRELLIEAGADVIIPDYREADALISMFLR